MISKQKGAKTFATANDLSRLTKPLQSRFRRLNLPPYMKEQFIHVPAKVLPKLDVEIAYHIGTQV
ncbi:MAG: hypothetical protein WA323_28110 [Candidatus Nitrosopolaris sp.]